MSEPQYELDSEIEVVEVDDTPEEDRRPVRNDVEPFNIDEEIETQDETVRKRINRLKYEYHQQRREKEAAQRLRDEAVAVCPNTAQRENRDCRGWLDKANKLCFKVYKTRTEAELESAREKYKKAHEEGDTE